EAEAATTLRAAPGYASSYCYSIRWNDEGPEGDEGEARSGCSEALPELVDFDGGGLAIPSIDAKPGSVQFTLSGGEPGDGLELQAQRASAEGAKRWRWSALRDPE